MKFHFVIGRYVGDVITTFTVHQNTVLYGTKNEAESLLKAINAIVIQDTPKGQKPKLYEYFKLNERKGKKRR